MRAVRLTPIMVGLGVGIGDGIIDPFGGKANIPYGHLGYAAAVTALGWFGTTGRRDTGVAGRWDPNASYGLLTAGVTLLTSRLPGVIKDRSLHAYGDVVAAPYSPPAGTHPQLLAAPQQGAGRGGGSPGPNQRAGRVA